MKQMCSESTGSNRIKTGSEQKVDQKWTGSEPEAQIWHHGALNKRKSLLVNADEE